MDDNGIEDLRKAVIKKFNSVVGDLEEHQLTTLHQLFQQLEIQIEANKSKKE